MTPIGGDLHSDEEALLLDDGSVQRDLWGINLYPEKTGEEMIEFDSMINVRPSQGNRSRDIEDEDGRWQMFTIAEQLANVGSEVERAIRAHEAGNGDRFDSALERALELFDLTAADDRWRGPRRREVLRAREEFCRLFFDDAASPESARGLRRYFLYFAIAARRSLQG